MPKKSDNNIRNVDLHFLVTPDEATQIRERMTATGMTSLGAYLRKMAINGMFVQLDLSDVKEMVRLLRNATTNINQIARRVNEIHSIYETDIEDLRRQYDTLWDSANKILANLAKI